MSPHQQLVADVYQAFDFKLLASGQLDGLWAAYMQPDFTVSPPDIYPDMEEYRGLARFKEFCTMLTGVWDEWTFEPLSMEEAGDSVLVNIQLKAKGRESGAQASEQGWHLWTVRDGRLASVRTYLDDAAAREAAGLSDLQSRG